MKKILLYSIITSSVLMLSSCDKEVELIGAFENLPKDKAFLKVVYCSAYPTRDSVQIKINDTRVSNTFISLGATFLPTPFPGGGINTGGSSAPDYLVVDPSSIKVSVSIPKRRSIEDSIVRFSGNTPIMEANKKYTSYITDTGSRSRLVLVPETGVLAAIGSSHFKFVNLIPNQPALDLYFGEQKVASNIAYGSFSAEFPLLYGRTAQWIIRLAGAPITATPLVVWPGTVAAPVLQVIPSISRSYTVFCKGYTGGTTTRTPTISLLINE